VPVQHDSVCRQGRLVQVARTSHPDLPALEDPGQRSVSVDICRAALLRGSPHQLSRISQRSDVVGRQIVVNLLVTPRSQLKEPDCSIRAWRPYTLLPWTPQLFVPFVYRQRFRATELCVDIRSVVCRVVFFHLVAVSRP
jgi:hypothetical protein